MNTLVNACNQEIWNMLSSLQKSVNQTRKAALKKRLIREPLITDLEYLLGAFLEMYEPHLEQVVHKFSEKGYAIEASSGFSGKYSEYQAVNGYFPMDYQTKSKLEKIGVKFREHDGQKSLIFWPEMANLEHIKKKWLQTIDALPDKGILVTPSDSYTATAFRRKYVPRDPSLQRQRLFERLYYDVRRKIENDLNNRRSKNPDPVNIELHLGVFVEELEPQVRQAVLVLNRKGYSTDTSGFMANPCQQMIEGDFQCDENTIDKLKTIGVIAETNVSGYTTLQFLPESADMQKIKKKWDEIVSLLPDKKTMASPAMTRQAREFRTKFSHVVNRLTH